MSPDVEALVVGFLTDRYEAAQLDATASTHVPGDRPAMFTKVTQTGGSRDQLVITQAELAVQCWGPDDVTASNLARLTEDLLLAMSGDYGGVWVRGVHSMGSVSYFPDPTSDQPRYQFAVQINVRG